MDDFIIAVAIFALFVESGLFVILLNNSLIQKIHSLIIILCLVFFQLGRRLIIFDMGNLSLLPSLVSDMFIIYFAYEATVQKKFFLAILYYTFMLVFDFAAALLVSYFYLKVFGRYLSVQELMLYSFIPAKILLTITILSTGKILKNGDHLEEWIMYLPVPIFIMFVLIKNYDYTLDLQENDAGLLAVLCICCFLTNVYMIISLQQRHAKILLDYRIKMINENKKSTEDYHLELQKLYRQVDHLAHDLQHHLDYIASCDHLDDVKGYIYEIKGRTVVENNCYSGNLDIDITLNALSSNLDDIALYCCNVLPLKFNWIQPVDMCIIIGNAVKNAIDACKKYNTKEIILSFSYSEDWLLISVENPVTELFKPNFKRNGSIKSTKRDAGKHGIGMESMKTTVERYDGYMDYEIVNNVFRLDIMLQKIK